MAKDVQRVIEFFDSLVSNQHVPSGILQPQWLAQSAYRFAVPCVIDLLFMGDDARTVRFDGCRPAGLTVPLADAPAFLTVVTVALVVAQLAAR